VGEAAGRTARRIEARVTGLISVPPLLPFALRTVLGTAALGIGANLVGAIVVSLLVIAVNASTTHHQTVVLLSAAGAVAAASVVIGCTAAFVVQRRTLRWVVRGLVPDEGDARRAVRLPLDLALIAAVIWAVDAVVVGALAVGTGVDRASVFGISSGVTLAGLCSAGVTYLLVGHVGQPVTRIALAAHPPGGVPMVGVRARLLLIWLLTTGVPLLGIVLILLAPAGQTNIRGASIVCAVLAILVGAASTGMAARSIGKPLRDLVGELASVGSGDLATEVVVADPGEIGLLQHGINEMVAGLRERERIRDLFGRHVGPAVAEQAVRSGVTLSGEARDVVALFVDITGSTVLTRTTEPVAFIEMLNRFFEIVVDAVESNGGLVNKFEGDAALCVFGAPVQLIDSAGAALRAARSIRDGVRLSGEVQVGIGVAAGPVVAGQIGASSRLEYTVIGDAVNEAARLTELAKAVPGRVLASQTVIRQCGPVEAAHGSAAGEVVLRGRDRATQIWTV
jgi:class 3 adenylate cyclase